MQNTSGKDEKEVPRPASEAEGRLRVERANESRNAARMMNGGCGATLRR